MGIMNKVNPVRFAFVSPLPSCLTSTQFLNQSVTTQQRRQRQRQRHSIKATPTTTTRATLIENSTTTTPSSESNGAVGPSTKEEEGDAACQLRLTTAEKARTLVHICKSATLCTASVKHAGIPFGSHVDFIQDDDGNPVFLLAANANHTRNLASEPRCSLFCQPSLQAGQDGCRVTLVGCIEPLNKELEDDLRLQYEEIHAHASEALKYKDIFKFYTMNVNDILFVSGYGVTSQWVDANDFENAQPDSLAFDAPSIVKDLNEEKQSDLKRLCKIFLNDDDNVGDDDDDDAGVVGDNNNNNSNNNTTNNNNNNNEQDIVSCVMTSLDRLGFDLRVNYQNSKTKEYRVAFREQVANRFDVQSALVKTFQEAWERENGFDETWDEEDTRPTILYYSQSPV